MTKHSDIFFQREQKMVDTMIACDLLSYCEESSTNCLYLISDDMDHFPALALCHKKKGGASYICRNKKCTKHSKL
ncbi:hypothetical protein ACIXJQ_02080 [Bacteroides fragilis]